MIWEKSITAEQLNVKIVSYNLYSHSTAPQLRQSSHFNPPIASKVIHIQSLRNYFNPLFALPITHYQSLNHFYLQFRLSFLTKTLIPLKRTAKPASAVGKIYPIFLKGNIEHTPPFK